MKEHICNKRMNGIQKISINDELSDVTADFVSYYELPLLRLFEIDPGKWVKTELLIEDESELLSRVRHVQSRCKGTLEVMWGRFEDDPRLRHNYVLCC